MPITESQEDAFFHDVACKYVWFSKVHSQTVLSVLFIDTDSTVNCFTSS